ncbi:MAG: hypothetical protein CBC52_006435 [Gammaproteobacteria bacterium TMED92]|nr:MAG: hypothetical protein CBC52_006435 [Gammaproteobacteria bacterium TMED92]
MSIPEEFTSQYIDHASAEQESPLYKAIVTSKEPYRSLAKQNFHQSAKYGYHHKIEHAPADSPAPGLDLENDDLYYNTEGAAADYWRDANLPKPSKNINRLRQDLAEWGYCLIDQALSDEQLTCMKQRISDQAAGERKAGIASWMGTEPAPGDKLTTTQFVHCLINKGQQFIDCVEHKTEGVQAAHVIERLISESIGERFLMSSFIAIITNKYNLPQGLHQDQAIAPFQDTAAPYTCNTMFILDDMGPHNGGTLVVPGSHKLLSAPGTGQPITTPLPPAINLTAPAGTVMIFEGRLLHGSGVNRSDDSRSVLVMNSIKPFMRQQELHMFSAHTETLKNASDKLLYRLGAIPTGLGGIEGAWNGDHLVGQRLALEQGQYLPVGELSPDSTTEELNQDFGYRHSEVGARQAPDQPERATAKSTAS